MVAGLILWCREAVAFDVVREYSGLNFFDRWDFFGSWDNLTLGESRLVMPSKYY
jgi:hypothetical protein